MSPAEFSESQAELRDVFESERLGVYLRELWRRRAYIRYVSSSELRNRQINTVLGNFWNFLNPALSIAVYYIIFGLVLQVDRGVDNFILFLTVGLFVFQYTQRSTVAGAKSVVGNEGLMKAIRFPRALLPITSTVTEAMAAVSSFGIIYVVAILTGAPVRWQWLLLPVFFAVQFAFNVGAAFLAARATTHFRDTMQFLPFVFRLLFYASGVIFNVDAYVESSTWSAIFVLNPMYCLVTIARWLILGGSLDGLLLLSAALWTVLIIIVGFLWFHAGEDQYGRA